MSEYTPTTDDIREGFAEWQVMLHGLPDHYGDMFDRWLKAHDAEVIAAETVTAREVIDAVRRAFNAYASPADANYFANKALTRLEVKLNRGKP